VIIMSYLVIIALAFLLSACATKDGARISTSATTPLRDFNLAQAEIPPVLADARKHPYIMPPDSSCKALNTDIDKLDEVLGPDIDVPVAEAGAADVVGETVGNAFKSMIEGVVPFRHWIRKLSGAEQHARDVTAAAAAGSARRAFLKGMRMINACPDLDDPGGGKRIAGTPP
jgi:hypothetical protein